MAKKTKEDPVPTINSVQNRDIIQRLNYMYQAGAFLQSLHSRTAPSSFESTSREDEPQRKKKKRVRGDKGGGSQQPLKTMADLGRSYVHSMKVVGQRTTVKMDPSIKRTICKGCDVALVPGMTVSTRVEKLRSHGHTVVYTCMNCKTKRRIPAPPIAPVPPIPLLAPDIPRSSLETATSIIIEDTPTVDNNLPPKSSPRIHLKPKRKPPQPRQPLLAARKDAGHVIFRGSEKLIEEDYP